MTETPPAARTYQRWRRRGAGAADAAIMASRVAVTLALPISVKDGALARPHPAPPKKAARRAHEPRFGVIGAGVTTRGRCQ